MNKYRVVASKTNKKYTIIVTAENENEAKNKVHKGGYSILSVDVLKGDTKFKGRKFVFIADVNGTEKRGIIVGNDIYKLYLKLVNELGYNLKYLYPQDEEDTMSLAEKKQVISMLENGYNLSKKEEKKEPVKKKKKENVSVDTREIDNSFYMKKELEETQALIETVLLKLTPIINQEKNYDLSPDKLQKLHNIYQGIMSIKNSTNIAKLKKIGELALLKIGEIELKALEQNKSAASKKLLEDTNNLLKQIGSSEKFKEKDGDVSYTFKVLLNEWGNKITHFFDNIKNKKNKNKDLDKQSYTYLKNILLLDKYTQKLNENTQKINQNILAFIFPFGKNKKIKNDLKLRRTVIKQNISLLQAKKKGKVQSYTSAINGGSKLIKFLLTITQGIGHFMYYIVFVFSIVFIGYMFLLKGGFTLDSIKINYDGIYFVILFSVFAALGSATKNIVLFITTFGILGFLVIFLGINF